MNEPRSYSSNIQKCGGSTALRDPRATVPAPRHVAPSLGNPAAAVRIRPVGIDESRAWGAAAPPGTNVSIHGAGDVTLMCIGGVLDMLSAPTLAEHVATVLVTCPRAVVIDLTDVEFLSAAGLEVLASARRTAGSSTRLAVVAASRAVRRPIELSGIDETVPVYSTLSAAIAAVTAGSAASID